MKSMLLVLISYALGSISPAYILGRALRGRDLRTLDSGNLGARNAGRVIGAWAGVVVLVLDGAKGYAAVALALALGASASLAVLCGAASVVGHNWPFYLGFRGGRGAATVAGAALALLPLEMTVALLACLVILRTVGSLYIGGFAAIVISTTLAFLLGHRGVTAWSPVLISLPLLARHVPDIASYVRGGTTRIP